MVRLVVAAIEKHARGDVPRLATGVIAELRQAGFEIAVGTNPGQIGLTHR
jgi:hypothetical protein